MPRKLLVIPICALGASAAVFVSYYIYKAYYGTAVVQVKMPNDDNNLQIMDSAAEGSENGKKLKLIQAQKELGNQAFKAGKYKVAIESYSIAIRMCPIMYRKELSVLYNNRASAYAKLEKWNNVEEDSTHSIQNNPLYAKAYYRRAKAREALNKIDECVSDAVAACCLEQFKDSTSISFASEIVIQRGCKEAEYIKENYQPILPSPYHVRAYFRPFIDHPLQKSYKKMDNCTNNLTGFLQAKRALDDEQYENILAACTEEINKSPAMALNKPKALLLRGIFHLLSGSFGAARIDFDAIIDDAQIEAEIRTYALLERASLHIQIGFLNVGKEDIKLAEDLSPNNYDVIYQKAQAFILSGELEPALQELGRATELAPDRSAANVKMALLQYNAAVITGNKHVIEQTMRNLQACSQKFPNDVDCCNIMGYVLFRQKYYKASDDMYQKAIELEPDNAFFYVQRALIAMESKADIKLVLEFLNQAIVIDGKCVLAYDTFAEVEIQRVNLNRAVEMFDKAIMFSRHMSKLSYLCAMRVAVKAQININNQLGLIPTKAFTLEQAVDRELP